MGIMHPDGRLVVRLRVGDIDALGELYEKYKTKISRTALAITRDPGAAEDISQETFMRLFTHAEHIYTDVPVGPWLYRVAVNLSHTWIQRQRRRPGLLEEVLDRLMAPLHLVPERMMERKEIQETVQQAIANLPLTHRTVVVLFYLESLSLKEISDILEIPEGTVKSRLHYARKQLKGLLSERRAVPEVVYEFT
ncbi:MAG: sigma-70 family RNA polymerase sigma factor [Anaerolineae bacterium]|nr:sigma-70 family RNA polymerase sigma factor [Anaerolineae bacterium]